MLVLNHAAAAKTVRGKAWGAVRLTGVQPTQDLTQTAPC